MIKILAFYIVPILFGVMGLITFIAYGIDKSKAQKKKWRIPEKTLFTMNLLGGWLGGWFGMFGFRHKTKHASFYAVQIISTVLWVTVWGFLMFKALT